MESEFIVPGGAAQLATDTALTVVLAEQGHRHTPEHSHVFRRRAILALTVVLPEDHIQHPVQTVLDTPVAPGGAAQFLCGASTAADVVGHLEGFLVPFPFGPGHPERGRTGPPFPLACPAAPGNKSPATPFPPPARPPATP